MSGLLDPLAAGDVLAFELTIVENDGERWGLHEVFAIRLPRELWPTGPGSGEDGKLPPALPEFLKLLTGAPPKSAQAELRRDATRETCSVGGVSIDSTYVAMILAVHPAAQWRATTWWEPVYAVVDDEVCAMLGAKAPACEGATS